MRSNKVTADQLLMAKEAAALAGLKERRFYTLLSEGRGPESITLGKTKFYIKRDVLDWKKKRDKQKATRQKS